MGRWDAEEEEGEEGLMQKLCCVPNFYSKLHRAYIRSGEITISIVDISPVTD